MDRLKATDTDLEVGLDAEFGVGLDSFKRGDMKSALKVWKPLAEKGHAEAAFRIAEMYEFAMGVPKDNRRSAKYYLSAAKSHNSKAQLRIAGLYEGGRGVKQNWEEALFWYFIVRNNKAATSKIKGAAEVYIGTFNSVFAINNRGAERAMRRAETRAKSWMSKHKDKYEN